MRNIPFGGGDEDDEEFDEDEALNIIDIIEQSLNEAAYDTERNQKILASAVKFVNGNPLIRLLPMSMRLKQLRLAYQAMDELTQYEESDAFLRI